MQLTVSHLLGMKYVLKLHIEPSGCNEVNNLKRFTTVGLTESIHPVQYFFFYSHNLKVKVYEVDVTTPWGTFWSQITFGLQIKTWHLQLNQKQNLVIYSSFHSTVSRACSWGPLWLYWNDTASYHLMVLLNQQLTAAVRSLFWHYHVVFIGCSKSDLSVNQLREVSL